MTDKFSDDPAINDHFFQQFSHPPFCSDGENSDVVVASRIQLFRNIADHPFVGVSSEEQQSAVCETITACIGRSSGLEDLPVVDSDQLKDIEGQFLLELQSVIDSTTGSTGLAQPQPATESESDGGEDAAVGEDFAGLSIENVSIEDRGLGDFTPPKTSDHPNNLVDHIRWEDQLEAAFLQQIEEATALSDFDAPPQSATQSDGADAVISPSHDISLTINEEDHLRLQLLAAGYPLDWMWKKISHIDDQFEQNLNYAFSQQWGYLSASPANVGTAMRVTVLLHLPALATLGRLDAAFLALMREGIVGRGVYSEEAWGDFFRIGNQVTLGKSESGLINLVRAVVPAIVDYERAARKLLFQQYGKEIESQTADACRALKLQVHRSEEELLSLISSVRLGIAFAMVSENQALAVQSNFELTRLKRKLELAISKEQYASATKYRDQIRQLEQRHYGH